MSQTPMNQSATRQTENQRIVLNSRPQGEPTAANFRLEPVPIPQPGDGEVLLQTLYLSLDPYMRGRMNAGKSYAPRVELGQVMVGGTVSRVVSSNHPAYAAGELVLGNSGWQQFALSNGEDLRQLVPDTPPTNALSVLGMTGLTAYTGLLDIGRPQAGETVVVSSAAGAVGSVVGQIAKLKGCRVVGIAGSNEKNAYLTDELGFDVSLNYKHEGFADELAAACPDGVDVYFENVGGRVFEAVLPLLNVGARVPVCGLIAHYNQTSPPDGPNRVPGLMSAVLTQRLTLQGFIVSDHFDRWPDLAREMGAWVRDGQVKQKEHVVEGLENAPKAFLELLKGGNFGKLLVQVSEPNPLAGRK